MIEVHPNILERDGKKEFAVLPYEEFESLMEALSDYEDLRDLREAKEAEGENSGTPLSEVRKKLGI
ncbi:MAG: type II toxin-antitoxin system Phd/YefM family antitoxin [Gammaproteobacteria bacterium]|nr:type II toxin-antitoxin system Phd/YefM family antitoxin [Gammaproteobacteria bacterium]MBU1655049.1 type II toxin-antitoxin system Phd/YefM family antitoxin [Gammaproteobacteria bacterium]MBU1961547.1 type II toxin-antitoxin system Phd/YefM family antitoxin [Gammaproteobacteria bacterium]